MTGRRFVLILPIALLAIQMSFATVQAASGIRVSKEQVVIVPAPMVHVGDVIEELTFVNSGSQALPVSVNVPQGATHLSITAPSSGAAFPTKRIGNGRWLIQRPIPSNSTLSVTVSFQLPFTSATGVGWSLDSDYAVDMIKLYLPIAGFSLSAPDLKAATETVALSGTQFRVFTRVGILPGDAWPISVEALPTVTKTFNTAGYPFIGQSSSGWINDVGAIGNIAIILFVLTLCLFGVKRGARAVQSLKPQFVPSCVDEAQTPVKNDTLYAAWTDLEMRYEDGEIPFATYQEKRNQFVQQLVEGTRKAPSTASPDDHEAGAEEQ